MERNNRTKSASVEGQKEKTMNTDKLRGTENERRINKRKDKTGRKR